MAIVIGTNAGFVLAAPAVDPADGTSGSYSNASVASKFTSPGSLITVSELGWYCRSSTVLGVSKVGIYGHDAVNDRPGSLVASYSVGADIVGWNKKAGISLVLAASTVYWLAFETSSATTNIAIGSVGRFGYRSGTFDLVDPWGVLTGPLAYAAAIYAVYSVNRVKQQAIFIK